MSQGILYILYDKGGQSPASKFCYLEELKRSIDSSIKFCDLPITVYTNKDSLTSIGIESKQVTIVRKEIGNLPKEKREDSIHRGYSYPKLALFKDLPYDTTIFLDVDTLLLDDPSKLISEEYDLAICREVQYEWKNRHELTKDFNTGFFIANKGEGYDSLIDKAIELMERYNIKCDQRAINRAVNYVYDINIMLLPQKWNMRGEHKPPMPPEEHKMRHWHLFKTDG